MALLAVINKAAFDILAADLKKEYKDVGNGNFQLEVAPVEIEVGGKKQTIALEDVAGLRSALQAERTTVGSLKGQLKDVEGLDVKAAKDALERVKKFGEEMTDNEKVKQQVESVKKQLTEKYDGEKSTLTRQVEDLEKNLSTILVDQAAMTALSRQQLIDGGIELLMPHIKSQVRIEKLDGGKRMARVIDPATGQDRLSMKPGNTGPMDLDEFVESMSKNKVYAPAFKGSNATGTKNPKEDVRKEPQYSTNGSQGSDGEASGRGGQRQPSINRTFKNPNQALIDVRSRGRSKSGT